QDWSTGGMPEPAIFPEILRPPPRWASQLVWPLPAAEAMPPSAESPPPIIPQSRRRADRWSAHRLYYRIARLSGVFRVASVAAGIAGLPPTPGSPRFDIKTASS